MGWEYIYHGLKHSVFLPLDCLLYSYKLSHTILFRYAVSSLCKDMQIVKQWHFSTYLLCCFSALKSLSMNTENEALTVQHSIDSLEAEKETTEMKRCCNNCYITLTMCSEKRARRLKETSARFRHQSFSLFMFDLK